jgi:hypothetical protein
MFLPIAGSDVVSGLAPRKHDLQQLIKIREL